jgi:radical SAM protein with 4Fe4S-binding SPASM domain
MTPLEKAKESKTFCIYPWVHQYVGPPGDVKPCCVFLQDDQIGDLKQETLKEIWNNETTRKMRVDMLEGNEVPGCAICNKRENLLSRTHKDDANHYLFTEDNYDLVNSTLEDGTVEVHQLQYIDARFNNLCNLKCRTCGPRFSTSWIEDHVKIYGVLDEDREKQGDIFTFPGKTEEQLLEEIMPHLPGLKQIYFAGGEPLMTIEHYKILEELIRIGHTGSKIKPLTINYNTNFSNLKLGKFNAIELWKKFDRININASLDGSHEKAEFWRKNTDWENIVTNRKRLQEECPNVDFKISFTTSWVNVHNLVEFHKEWVKLGYIRPSELEVNLLDTPPMYSLKSVPTWKKQKIEKVLLEHIQWLENYPKPWLNHNRRIPNTIQRFKDAINFMYSVDSGDDMLHKLNFIKISTKLDEIRNEDFWSVFPEHLDIKEFLNV